MQNRPRAGSSPLVGMIVSGLALLLVNPAGAARKEARDAGFSFVQLSDIHWGFSNPTINPNPETALRKTIALVNNLVPPPDFIICTGDLTHTTNDSAERRKRMSGLKDVMSTLKVKDVRYLPGEHDAALDSGAAFREAFGPTHYTFDHKGVHFIVLDNCSDPSGALGDAQLNWLSDDLKKLNSDSARIVVFTHRPLFDLYPAWDWNTRDGAKALALLAPFKNVPVFYGHIHQYNCHITGQITHYAAKGLMYPLPAEGSVPKKAPVPWDSAQPCRGLGFRRVEVKADPPDYVLTEYAVDENVPVISITARQFEYSPSEIRIKKGAPVILELTSLDRLHGFNCPGLSVRADVKPGEISRVRLLPATAGTFEFHCDNFCGEGHSNMTGKIIVEE